MRYYHYIQNHNLSVIIIPPVIKTILNIIIDVLHKYFVSSILVRLTETILSNIINYFPTIK